MLVKNFVKVSRIECKLPNVCVVDVKGVEVVRLLGVYAPTSRSWNWQDLSPYVTKKCIIYGDFNIDFCQDIQKAESLLSWADEHFLAPFLTGMPTSLRSDREVDYAFASNINITIQAYSGKTTSDHVPILSVIPFKIEQNNVGKNVHWKVFSLFTKYTFSFWEGLWNFDNLDILYNDYTKFLFLLSARCTIVFPIEKYRPAIPAELRSFLSFIRALSFRQMRTKCSELRNEVNCLGKIAKKELKNFFSSNLSSVLRFRNSSSPAGNFFWSRSKKHLKPSSSSVHALIDSSGKANKDPVLMCEVAADYYEKIFRKSVIIRPHPYTDSPFLHHENVDELIPENTILPDAWKETRMILIAKKESICSPALTRPISLIDSFLKIGERLLLNRFRDVLLRRGLLPDNQSGFRDGFRLQTRLLLFLEDVYSLMSNSAPVCTIFIDFRSAFDQLWHSGCIDDVAAILAGQMGVRFTDQCLYLEKRVKSFLDRLEFYSCLSDQPLNRSKTDALFSAPAIGLPKFTISFDSDCGDEIKWKKEYKYLGYIIPSKLGWGKLIKDVECKVRKRISLIRSFKLFGCSSPSVRKVLFYSHVLPIFTWIYPVYPLLTRKQHESMCKFYYTSLRRVLYCLEWNEIFFSYVLDELSLEDRCSAYWNRYLIALSDSTDGNLLVEKANLLFVGGVLTGYAGFSAFSFKQTWTLNTASGFKLLPLLTGRNELAKLILSEGFISGAEVGVHTGLFSEILLKDWTGCKEFHVIDVWAKQANYLDTANVDNNIQENRYQETRNRLKRFEHILHYHRNYSHIAVNEIKNNSLDFIYIDARHDYAGVMQDMILYWSKVKTGGVFSGHDYLDTNETTGIVGTSDWGVDSRGIKRLDNKAVKSAVNEFAMKHQRQILVTYAEQFPSWYMRK
ncbi:unnamed protein product [Adineta steineri]|uniref:Reverse transcriptase domain-containing protein n=1 Tax=Adineta steineri TaxID=433720 RepID=A0A819QJN9_9BILA|nr:unnamed protein product [Adineta steineri]